MTIDPIDDNGFVPRHRIGARGRRSAMLAQLIASAALVLSIAVAAAAVSIGIARADAGAPAVHGPSATAQVQV